MHADDASLRLWPTTRGQHSASSPTRSRPRPVLALPIKPMRARARSPGPPRGRSCSPPVRRTHDGRSGWHVRARRRSVPCRPRRAPQSSRRLAAVPLRQLQRRRGARCPPRSIGWRSPVRHGRRMAGAGRVPPRRAPATPCDRGCSPPSARRQSAWPVGMQRRAASYCARMSRPQGPSPRVPERCAPSTKRHTARSRPPGFSKIRCWSRVGF